MLLTRQRPKRSSTGLNMTPMIDAIFLLLIFFMCSSSLRSFESQLPTQISQRGSGQKEEPYPPIRIRLTKTAAGVLVLCDEQPCSDFHDLTGRLKKRRAIADAAVIIEGGGRVPFGRMVAALDACHQADLRRVAFSPTGGAK